MPKARPGGLPGSPSRFTMPANFKSPRASTGGGSLHADAGRAEHALEQIGASLVADAEAAVQRSRPLALIQRPAKGRGLSGGTSRPVLREACGALRGPGLRGTGHGPRSSCLGRCIIRATLAQTASDLSSLGSAITLDRKPQTSKRLRFQHASQFFGGRYRDSGGRGPTPGVVIVRLREKDSRRACCTPPGGPRSRWLDATRSVTGPRWPRSGCRRCAAPRR
jgi:hypothetical protein